MSPMLPPSAARIPASAALLEGNEVKNCQSSRCSPSIRTSMMSIKSVPNPTKREITTPTTNKTSKNRSLFFRFGLVMIQREFVSVIVDILKPYELFADLIADRVQHQRHQEKDRSDGKNGLVFDRPLRRIAQA